MRIHAWNGHIGAPPLAVNDVNKPASSRVLEKNGVEPVFRCNTFQQRGVLRLKRGNWMGQMWTVELKCCENPLCGCPNVDFYCATDDGSKRPLVLHFTLDPLKRAIVPNNNNDRHENSGELAEAVAAEFGEEEWRCLRQYLLTWKRKAIRDMDVTRLPALPSLRVMTDDGRMVGFVDIFPFAEGFEFDLDGERWVADDQYCVMPDCDCRESVLNFLHLISSPNGQHVVKEPIPAAGYDYKRKTIRPEQRPAAGEPSLEALVVAVQAAHPSLAIDMELRHNQLKLLYARALLKAKQKDMPHAETAVKAEPKVGRNEPCLCGSGKKYKKCCGRLV